MRNFCWLELTVRTKDMQLVAMSKEPQAGRFGSKTGSLGQFWTNLVIDKSNLVVGKQSFGTTEHQLLVAFHVHFKERHRLHPLGMREVVECHARHDLDRAAEVHFAVITFCNVGGGTIYRINLKRNFSFVVSDCDGVCMGSFATIPGEIALQSCKRAEIGLEGMESTIGKAFGQQETEHPKISSHVQKSALAEGKFLEEPAFACVDEAGAGMKLTKPA